MDFSNRAVRIPFSRLLRWGVLDWFRGRRRWPSASPATPRIRRAHRRMDEVPVPSLTWCGHASALLRMNGTSILTDPIWHRALVLPRLVRAAPSMHHLPLLGAVAVTHSHYDHLSMPTLRQLARQWPPPLGICPLGLGRYLRRAGFPQVVELDWWDHTRVGEIDVTLVPARHWSRRGLFDTNTSLWGGYVFSGERKVWFSGDTALFDGVAEIGQQLGPLDAALLPIGAYDPEWFMRHQHMTPEDAGEAFLASGARMLGAVHWGTFRLSDEPVDEPPRRLRAWWEKEPREGKELWIPAVGESRSL